MQLPPIILCSRLNFKHQEILTLYSKATLFLSIALFNFGSKQFDNILFDADNGFLKNFTDNFYLLISK